MLFLIKVGQSLKKELIEKHDLKMFKNTQLLTLTRQRLLE